MHSFNDFTVGTAVWYKTTDDEGASWATATVTGTDAAASTLTLEPTNGPAFALAHTACHLVNPASHRGVDDLTSLAYLHEPAILGTITFATTTHGCAFLFFSFFFWYFGKQRPKKKIPS